MLGTAQAGWAAPGADAASAGTATGSRGIAVTLLTGDQILLASADADSVAVRPGKNRQGVRFATYRSRDALYVIPADAQPLVQAGKLDKRLFDVRGLIRAGYHDAVRDSLPLIVQYGQGAAAQRAGATLSAAGAKVTRQLAPVGGAALAAKKDRAAEIWAAVTAQTSVKKIWLDGKRRVSLDKSVPQIGAPAAWQAGYTGEGITVAVLDTGIDTTHPDLAGKVAESRNFTEDPENRDIIGHGTHVASTIAGSGAASGGKYKGVAPDATLLSGKVCESTFCTESAILAGMEWAAAEKHATAINLSLGGGDTPEIDPLEEAVDRLTAETGTLFVIAAGNSGSGDGTIDSPGSADAALTVGAVDKSDELAEFSSRGPRVGDDGMKPDITAPGVDIVAAKAAGTEMGETVDGQYVSASGTSMATPHVVGAVALLAEQHPDWKAGQLKATLTAAAKPNPSLTAYQQGAGRVDVARAITQTVTTDPVGVSFGRPLWPHNDDEPIARTVTYRNGGTAAVTLDLGVAINGPDGAPAPAGMFTPSATQITVPAGGQAQVTVTANTRVAGPDGLYSGQLVATGGSSVVQTALGVNKEVESYNVTVTYLDRNGATPERYLGLIIGLDSFYLGDVFNEEGTATRRVPKGRYSLSAFLDTRRGEDDFETTLVVQPLVNVTKDTAVTLDARQGKPVLTTIPERSAVPALIDISFVHFTSYGWSFSIGVWADAWDQVTTAQIGAAPPASEFVSYVASQWAKPDAEGSFADSPYFYGVAESFPGRLPTGYTKHYQARDLATVRQEFGVAPAGLTAERFIFPELSENLGASAIVLPTDLPGRRTEYFSTKGVKWAPEMWFGVVDEEGWLNAQAVLVQTPVAYRAGTVHRDAWNTGPFGPVLGTPRWDFQWVSRQGDQIYVDMSFYGDRAGHQGYSLTDTSRTALYRNGKLVGEFECSACGAFEVPPGQAVYRLEAADTRSVGDLTTKVSGVWTFRSAHVGGERFAKLPVSVVRFAPRLDVNNAAPAGKAYEIPVTVQRQPGAPGGRVKTLTVEVSYDDGKTWQKASLRKTKDGWVAKVKHPRGGGFVSLRAAARDTLGNTVTQTVIHAYRLK
ncbi:S8 family serine peptidase [Phytohabitans rumicis]|uniref:S8 family serine peptidase n=1 Tax=Phytohabitans rumicis TaxID=1076125 RepID=UPI001566C92E|nr:S8 family serine peptidase [Phytohabitans rumicis]